MTSHIIKRILANRGKIAIIQLTQDLSKGLPDRFFFVAIHPEKEQALANATNISSVSEFGSILYRGYGIPTKDELMRLSSELEIELNYAR